MPIIHTINGSQREAAKKSNVFYTIDQFKKNDSQALFAAIDEAIKLNPCAIKIELKELAATYVDNICQELTEVDQYLDKHKTKLAISFTLDKLPIESVVLFYKTKILNSAVNFTVKEINRTDPPDFTDEEQALLTKLTPSKKRTTAPMNGYGLYSKAPEKSNEEPKVELESPTKKQMLETAKESILVRG